MSWKSVTSAHTEHLPAAVAESNSWEVLRGPLANRVGSAPVIGIALRTVHNIRRNRKAKLPQFREQHRLLHLYACNQSQF